jgi:hypothetical protein
MSHLRRAAVLASLTALLTVAAAGPASAHEAWFVEHPQSFPLNWAALRSPGALAGVLAVLAVAVVWRAVAGRLPHPELAVLAPLARLAPWVPRLLGAHLGLSLLALTLRGDVLDPSVHTTGGAGGLLMLAPQVVAGALLVAGVAVRAAALLVVAAGPVLVVLHGPRSLALCAVLVGIALFLVLVPPRRADAGRAVLAGPRLRAGLLVLRLGAATSLISLAVVEKLANPAMGAAMLEQQPALNLLSPLGVSASGFVLFAGCVEVLFGLLVLSGAAPQVVGLVAAVPFTASLALFGGTELVGHLPVYGVLLAFVVLGSRADTASEVTYLPSVRRRETVAA